MIANLSSKSRSLRGGFATKQSPKQEVPVIDSSGCWLLTLSFRRGKGEAAVMSLLGEGGSPKASRERRETPNKKHCITYKP